MNLYPKQWNFFQKKIELGQLSHAYLFAGEEGIGKKTFAQKIIKFINCLSNDKPCGKCVNCQMFERGSFPDFMLIEKKEGKNDIEILQIREAQKFLSYKSYYGSFKALIIDDAEKMNQEAQSCFLKTLEEPKGKTLLFLITSKPDILLPTIISRCQVLKFFKPKNLPENIEKIKKEQKILKNLLAVIDSNFSEKFKYVKSLDFEEQDPMEILAVLQKHFREKLLNNFSDKKAKSALELSEEISNKLIFTNANPKLALEILLMEI